MNLTLSSALSPALSPTRKSTALKLALALSSLTVSAYATSADDTVETPWYQVEVIIFSQQDLFQAEQPRTDIELNYPNNWLRLIDPKAPLNSKAQQATEPAATLNSAESDTSIGAAIEAAIEPAIETPASAVLGGALDSEPLPEKPIEQPFLMLDKDQQQLGPDHYTLRRAPGYRVLYHQAWRQPGMSYKDAPWIVVQGGEQYDNHFELEGSIRLVKSRHLHIQADLWKTSFELKELELKGRLSATQPQTLLTDSSEIVKPSWPTLPEIPQPAEPELESEAASELEQQPLTAQTVTLSAEHLKNIEQEITPATEIAEQLATEDRYQVASIATLQQSLKLSFKEMGYLDHPNMGLLVLVTKYEQ